MNHHRILRRVSFYAALIAFSGLLALVAGEIILRLVPIPGITYHSFYYDSVTGGKYYPHTTLMFRGEDGVLIKRRANAWGYADVEHEAVPVPGTLRIGFFGDSYTEALQVELEQTFFRVIEKDLNTHIGELAGVTNRRGERVKRIEALAFGMSGRGTLQSYLECARWMRRVDLDVVVYVFVENDPADQIRRLKGSDAVPYPILAADSFVVDASFNERYGYKTSWWHRLQQRIKSHSLVASTIEGRVRLLQSYGVKRSVTAADREGGAGGGGSAMAPSSWPPELVPEGWELIERVTDRWRHDVEGQGRQFVIMRVPRGNTFIDVLLEGQDTWAPRLHDYCARRGMALVDPTPYFIPRVRAGEKMYGNHFTPAGHRAFAESFVGFFLEHEAHASSAPASAPSH